jgi:hypothetical protein
MAARAKMVRMRLDPSTGTVTQIRYARLRPSHRDTLRKALMDGPFWNCARPKPLPPQQEGRHEAGLLKSNAFFVAIHNDTGACVIMMKEPNAKYFKTMGKYGSIEDAHKAMGGMKECS